MTKVGIVLPAVAMRDHRVVAELVLVERGDDAEHAADEQRQDQRRGAELHRDRQAGGEQLGDGEVGQIVARAEIAVQQVVEIVEILDARADRSRPNCASRLALDLRTQAALLVERAAGSHADQEEGQRDDDEQRRYGGQEPPEHVDQHGRVPRRKRSGPPPARERRPIRDYSLLTKRVGCTSITFSSKPFSFGETRFL